MDSTGCIWCDSIDSQNLKLPDLRYEEIPGSQKFNRMENPIEINKIIPLVKSLVTKDLHSISFTGGEPLYQLNFLLSFADALKEVIDNYPLYLETNGTMVLMEEQFQELGKFFEYCCCDIKDRSSNATHLGNWKNLAQMELKFIKNMISYGVNTFPKIVVTSQTKIDDIHWICEELSKIKYIDGDVVGLAIQPVFLETNKLKNKFLISTTHLNEIFYTAAEFLPPGSISLSIQAHKFLNLL